MRPRASFIEELGPDDAPAATSQGRDTEPRGSVTGPQHDLWSFRKPELEALLVEEYGAPKYRASQLWKWMYERGATSFDDMSDLPVSLRTTLHERATLGSTLSIADEQISARDGTVKRAYALNDGQVIESVLMRYQDGRRTACISSQAGCAMGCTFCATGQMGLSRQLTTHEIFEQVQRFSSELQALDPPERLSGVVLMGMGEAFANFGAVRNATLRMINELGIGARHITISTVGLAPRIRQLAREPTLKSIGLAVSLHSVDDVERSKIMPVNRRFPIAELMDACKEYVDVSGRRITFEWALIAGVNDDAATARALAARLLGAGLRGRCHVNVIPLNPTAGFRGGPSRKRAVDGFIATLEAKGVPATIRVRRGIDIDAGCGQLTAKVVEKQKTKAKTAAAATKAQAVFAAAVAAVPPADEAAPSHDQATDGGGCAGAEAEPRP